MKQQKLEENLKELLDWLDKNDPEKAKTFNAWKVSHCGQHPRLPADLRLLDSGMLCWLCVGGFLTQGVILLAAASQNEHAKKLREMPLVYEGPMGGQAQPAAAHGAYGMPYQGGYGGYNAGVSASPA